MKVTGEFAHKEFLRDNLGVLIAQLLLKLRGIILLPFLVRLLGKESYGIWVQLTTLQILLAQLCTFNLEKPMILFVSQEQTILRLRRIYWSAVCILITFGTCVVLMNMAFIDIITKIIGLREVDKYLFFFALYSMLGYCIFSLNLNFYRGVQWIRLRSVLEVLAAFGELAGSIAVLLIIEPSLKGVFVWSFSWRSLIALITTTHISLFVGVGLADRNLLKALITYALPVFPSTISSWVMDRFDRFLLGYYCGIGVVGKYNAIYSLMQMLNIFSIPLQVTLLPWLSSLWKDNRKEAINLFLRSSTIYLVITTFFGFMLTLISHSILNIMTHGKIQSDYITCCLIGIGMIFWGLSAFQVMILHVAKQPFSISKAYLIGATVNIGLNVFLIPTLEIKGAAIATAVSYVILCILYLRMSLPYIREHEQVSLQPQYFAHGRRQIRDV